MSLHVLRPGLLTTVQDLGRGGLQRFGIVPGGAMDTYALRIANLLIGNAQDAAALEITLVGPVLRFEADTLVAIAGASLGATIDGFPVSEWRALRVPAGATLGFGGRVSGCRAYLAIAGGIDVPPVLGSRATFLRARFGGAGGRAVRAGDALRIGAPAPRAAGTLRELRARDAIEAPVALARAARPDYRAPAMLRALPAAQHDWFAADAFWNREYRVLSESDRMGYRLEGAPLRLADPRELVSEPVAFGSVQVPPGGQPILLMADRQTTGGYPRIAEVIGVDLPLAAQLAPGDALRFRRVDIDEAERLWLERERAILTLARELEAN